jgi:cardiolipin synthase
MGAAGAVLGVTLHIVLALSVSVHLLLHKRDVAAIIGWMGLAWLSPFLGPLLYLSFGINRVRRRAYRVGIRRAALRSRRQVLGKLQSEHFLALERAVSVITKRSTMPGTAVRLLRNGEQAYPVMLQAIAEARTCIGLSSYIFLADEAGNAFIDALIAAKERGAEVRVSIDGIGSGYFLCRTAFKLRRHGIPVSRFMHSWLPWRMAFLNLRNHKKILVVDGKVAFIGGLNISAHNLKDAEPRTAIRDMHFEVKGPVVAQIVEAFAADWMFSTEEELKGSCWYPELPEAGKALARVVTSGPDQDIEKIEYMFLQAISSADRSIRIITPYFLPDERLVTALSLAAMRGVEVTLVIPENSDHRVLDWAFCAHIAPLLASGGRIWRAPQPFEHSKLLTVDDGWSLIGSANWDMRSLRLNFELNMEVYDNDFAALVSQRILERRGEEITLDSLNARPLLVRLRDSAIRLLLPYL